MYYVPDGTEQCGYYECKECGSRFLDLKIAPTLVCPYCGEEADMEIGPDEEMPKVVESAKLIQMVRGVEEVEKMDKLLSLAVTGGDFNWIGYDGCTCIEIEDKAFEDSKEKVEKSLILSKRYLEKYVI